jgi:hypothetical protein
VPAGVSARRSLVGTVLSVRCAGEKPIRAVALASLAGIVGAVVWAALSRPPLHGDSNVLVHSAGEMVHCLRHGRFTHCDTLVVRHGSTIHTQPIGPFALLQYLPAVALRSLSVSNESTLRVLVALNSMSLIAILGLARRTLHRLAPPLWAPLVTVVLLASPLLWYGRVAFGEELAAAVILAALVAVLVDASPVVVATMVALACLTKETNPPFVLALTAICVLARTSGKDPTRRRFLLAIVVGTTIGIVLNAGFNIFRYGTVGNANYTRGSLHAPNAGVVARVFATEWLAPNAGLAWFWPLAPVLIFAIAVVCFRRNGPLSLRRVAAPAVAVLLVAQVALLATWFSPFGWYAWGPRLVLPLVPALLVAACVLGARDATRTVARFLTSRGLLPATIVAVVVGLPQAVVVFHGVAVSDFFSHPVCVNAAVMTAPTRYYECLERTAWSKRPWMLQLGMHGLDSPQAAFIAIAFICAIVSLVWIARRAATVELRMPPGASRRGLGSRA